jgi:peptide deformylase
MPARPPNFFDELPRMRTVASLYNPSYDYRRIIKDLSIACKAHHFIGISPHNIVRGMPLLPVIGALEKREPRFFVDPIVVKASGARRRYEACGNVYLIRDSRRFNLDVLTVRPTRLVLMSRNENGKQRHHYFNDTQSMESERNGFVGMICHEIDHLNGKLIVDIARDRLVSFIALLDNGVSKAVQQRVIAEMPFVLLRKGDGYVLEHGAELRYKPIPEVSPDVLFFSPGIVEGFAMAREIERFRVPRGGELLPIRLSESLKLLLDK